MQFTKVHGFTSYYSLKETKKTILTACYRTLFLLKIQRKPYLAMLYEIPHLRQSKRSVQKRWFTSRDMDLFIWFHNDAPVRFQLTYDKRSIEKAISWNVHHGFRHYLVDTGEYHLEHYKQTPILIESDARKNLTAIARNFLAASENISIGLADFIYARLMAQPIATVNHGARHTDWPRTS